jgi:HemK-related putative methylase
MAADWKIRARSYETLIERIVEPMELRAGRSLAILDLGAGNGWLANRLAEREHRVAAVDLRVDPFDGLGAYIHYQNGFVPVQAEYDRLPFAGAQFDLVIFNASLHYSADYQITLQEALRVLGSDGHLVIIDSPVYRDPESGRAMVREREASFLERFGFPSNQLPAENFLTHARLRELAGALGLQWRLHEPFYGFAWALRPWRAKLRRRREPARFYVIDGRRTQAALTAAGPGRVKRAAGRFLTRWRYRLTQRGRYRRLVLEEVSGYPLVVLPDVFNPAIFRTGAFLAEALADVPISSQASVLDMGSGSGIAGIAAAQRAGRVVAVDINPEAVRCTRINALLNRVEDRLVAREGDLFEPVGVEKFDVVLFNPPYFRGRPTDLHDHAWRSEDVVERFAAGLGGHLKPGGCALVVLSTDGETPAFLDAFRAAGLEVAVAARRELLNETLTIFRLTAKE